MKKISFIGQPEYYRFVYENDMAEKYDSREFPFKWQIPSSLQAKELIDFSADFNFIKRIESFPIEVMKKLKGVNVALSFEPFPRIINSKLEYTPDSINRYRAFKKRILNNNANIDYFFHYDQASVDLLREDGIMASGSFIPPIATDTYNFRPLKKEWDLFFIGRSSEHREKMFSFIKHKYNFLHICHGIFGPPLVNYINRSKISLNIHASPEVSWEPRIQTLLACKAFVISEKITPNKVLRPNIDYIESKSDKKELQEIIEYYLTNPSEREKIANNGYVRVREMLSSKRNFSTLINDIENNKFNKFSVNPHNKGQLLEKIMAPQKKCSLKDKIYNNLLPNFLRDLSRKYQTKKKG